MFSFPRLQRKRERNERIASHRGMRLECLTTDRKTSPKFDIASDQNSFIATAAALGLCLLALPSHCFTTAIRCKINSAKSYFLDSS